jgi:hypothetical protein
MILLHETQTFSPASLYNEYISVQEVRIEACENYQKRSLRNKYYILTSQGPLAMTIPLKSGKNAQMPIKEVSISYEENWPKHHLHTLKSAYGKSPYFEFYFDKIENLFHKNIPGLYDFNMSALSLMLKLLKLPVMVTETKEYKKETDNFINNQRNKFVIQPEILEMKEVPYVQVWSKQHMFYQGLSILDTLFCMGPQTTQVLTKLHGNTNE